MALTKRESHKSLQRKWDDYPPAVQAEMRALEQDLGGRRELVALLSLAPLTKDTRYILGLLADPANDLRSLASVCADGGILPGDLLRLLGAAALHRGQTLAKAKIGQHLSAVAEDLMEKAHPYEGACSQCLGTGSITDDPTPQQPNPSPQPCDVCKGTGKLVYQPTFERQKLALELGGMMPKSGGLTIQQNNLQLNQGAGSGGALEQLQIATDRLLFGGDDDGPVDGEVLDPPEAS